MPSVHCLSLHGLTFCKSQLIPNSATHCQIIQSIFPHIPAMSQRMVCSVVMRVIDCIFLGLDTLSPNHVQQSCEPRYQLTLSWKNSKWKGIWRFSFMTGVISLLKTPGLI